MKTLWILIALILLLGIGGGWWWYTSQPKLGIETELRAAMDIGSGSTNVQVAEVNVKTGKIVNKIFEQSIPVPYQKHLEQSSNQTFDPEIKERGIQVITTLKENAEAFHVKKIVAVATAAFRSAANAPEFVKEIKARTGLDVKIISQEDEGILGFRGALAVTSLDPKKTVVWDIGGGSMQMTTLTPNGKGYVVEKGTLASIPFKNLLIQKIKGEDPKRVFSPNPLTEEQMFKGAQAVRPTANAINPYIQKKISDPTTKVIGIGNVFNFGVRPLVYSSTFTEKELAKNIQKLANKTDSELGKGEMAEVAVSNPLLILGYMDALDISQVKIVSVNNTDGALTYAPYWK